MNRMMKPIIIAPPPPPISLTPAPSRANKPPAKNTKLIGKNSNRNPSNGTGFFRKYENPQKRGTRLKKNAASPITEINAAEILAPMWTKPITHVSIRNICKRGIILVGGDQSNQQQAAKKKQRKTKDFHKPMLQKSASSHLKKGFFIVTVNHFIPL